jgi:hypothetical protein
LKAGPILSSFGKKRKAMNTPTTRCCKYLNRESSTTIKEAYQFNALFVLVNATFLLMAWWWLNMLA